MTSKIKHSKYKSTGLLFELLVRQVTADTLSGKKKSEALNIMQKYFNVQTELGKELQLYRAFFNTGPLTENKAMYFIQWVLDRRKQLNEAQLNKEKYALVKEIRQRYPLKEFLSCKIPDYTVYASIHKTFVAECIKDMVSQVTNVQDVARAKFSLVEHLSRSKAIVSGTVNESFELFKNQDEDFRMLTYKLLVEKFNEKYSSLSSRQRALLREYINCVSTPDVLKKYIKEEIATIKSDFKTRAARADKITKIKLNEIASHLDTFAEGKTIEENELQALMIVYDILEELA